LAKGAFWEEGLERQEDETLQTILWFQPAIAGLEIAKPRDYRSSERWWHLLLQQWGTTGHGVDAARHVTALLGGE
jgi:hypothetical protein